MTIIGVTGHQRLPDAARALAERDISSLLDRHASVTGMSSLAEGADQLFARLVLEASGELHAVLPSRGYETSFHGPALDAFHHLVAAATTVTELDFPEPSEAAFRAAGHYVVEHCDVLVAVWDGQPARGVGGTGDAVAHARALARQVLITWPPGFRRL